MRHPLAFLNLQLRNLDRVAKIPGSKWEFEFVA
jgi:hypothetical protein